MADAALSLDVVIERRMSESRWQDYSWHALGVLPAGAEAARWRELKSGKGWTQYLAATLPLELFRGETEGYLSNLSQPTPQLFVVLRRGEEADEREVEPFHLTACPYEAMSYIESGDEIVDGVAMPAEIAVWLQAFVDRHHVEQPFRKRKNRRHDPEAGALRPRGRGPGEGRG